MWLDWFFRSGLDNFNVSDFSARQGVEEFFEFFLSDDLAGFGTSGDAAGKQLTFFYGDGTDSGKGNGGQNNGKQNGHNIPLVPEANPAWVLVPFFGAVLLFSSRYLFRAKASKGNA